MTNQTEIRYIDSPAALDELCRQLSHVSWIALDTEFMREKTYYPGLCLIQVATPDLVACIDPLAISDLSPFLDVIYDSSITIVMHAARQDLEILYHLRGTLPAPVFDTQIAALLLGLPDQTGYGNLVKAILGVNLEKLHTRADWSVRPLTRDQIKYAADDVIYLVEAYQQIVTRLTELGRIDWLADDFENLVDPALYNNQPELAWLKVRGSNRLKGASLAILQALARWREETARRDDRPRGWLLKDDVLIDIARHIPGTRQALGKIRGLHDGMLNKYGEQLLEAIQEAKDRQPAPFPRTDKRARLTPAQDAVVDVMMALVRISGTDNSLNPAVLASRKQLEELMVNGSNSAVMRGWRKKLVGDRLQALLDGHISLSVNDGKVALHPPGTA
ncbi:MAG: ribonuclease D [Gammaproteobacteria bacterium]